MKILLVHQNFPGQFARLLPALLANPDNEVVAFTMNGYKSNQKNLRVVKYAAKRNSTQGIHPWVVDIETKVIRAEAAFFAAKLIQKNHGFTPDLIYAHPGWGESLFLKEVWPKTPLVIYAEFFYSTSGGDVGFDPEFHTEVPGEPCRIFMKNVNQALHFDSVSAAISPTAWQKASYPKQFQPKIHVCHDGVDTERVMPNPHATLEVDGQILSRDDEILTFVNRTLEPYRGYHVFMRTLPKLLRERPSLKVLIVGRDSGGYGAQPLEGKSWKQIFLEEVQDQLDLTRVFFLGNIPYPEYLKLLQVSTVHVYLTYPFVLSWSLLEAMSAGCAIVASDTEPVKEAIEHNNNGLLVNFFNTEGLATSVLNLLNDATQRQRLGANARNTVINNYDIRKTVPRLVDILMEVSKNKDY
jgi:glycosyltransferase involved in cell wall biosynthesis